MGKGFEWPKDSTNRQHVRTVESVENVEGGCYVNDLRKLSMRELKEASFLRLVSIFRIE
jgi:phage FluMu protein gp41